MVSVDYDVHEPVTDAVAALQPGAPVAVWRSDGNVLSRSEYARGDVDSALTFASDAVAHARQRRERAWLAEALELRAGIVRPAQARAALLEALQVWQDSGAGHDADRVLVHLSRLPSSSVSERLSGRLALARLAADDVLPSIRFLPESAPAPVQVRTFGRFEVLLDGAVVPAEAWQSRQARELLRLLVCRRGRAVPRLEICELLWPDDDPDRTAHRLSVVLSLLRGVIGQEALEANQACVALSSGGVQVDVEQFLTDVADAVALSGQGSVAEARSLLTEAVGSYVDDPFADAPYDATTEALRDEARAAYLQALRLLAEFCRRAGEDDLAAAYLRRLLENDRYDESAHRGLLSVLVRAGRHGQARLAATRYRAAMADLGLRPAV